MRSDKTTPIDFAPGKERLARYTIAIINAVTLIGTILFVTWVLGKIIAALHALVFSLALAQTPAQFPTSFQIPEDAITNAGSPLVLPDTETTHDNPMLTIVQHSDWR
jgi:hypothetical protein